MNINFNKLLIAFSLVILLSGSYVYFFNGLKSEAESSLSSSTGAVVSPLSSPTPSDNKISSDISFISTLTALTKIKIDNSLFSSRSFTNLKDNTVSLEIGDVGRENPFAPIEGSSSGAVNVVATSVTTMDPTEVTAKSAVFNGTLNNAVGIVNTYFEYGTTDKMGKTTDMSSQSLIGTFVKNVTGLTPKTTYFLRAVAKANNTFIYGETVSFTTK